MTSIHYINLNESGGCNISLYDTQQNVAAQKIQAVGKGFVERRKNCKQCANDEEYAKNNPRICERCLNNPYSHRFN